MRRHGVLWGTALAALLLSGCAATSPPAGTTARSAMLPRQHPSVARIWVVTRHPRAYMARHFSPARLPAQVRAEIARAGAVSLPFHRLVVTRQFVRHATYRNVDIHTRVTDTFINIGHGYLEDRERIAVNSIPVALNLNLSYLGLLSVEHQHIRERATFVHAPMRLQQLTGLRPGVAHPLPRHTYRMTVRWSHRRTSDTCRAGRRYYPARRLLAQLPGRALNLECTISRGGLVRSRNRVTYLTAYGIFLILQRDTPAYTLRAKIVRIGAS